MLSAGISRRTVIGKERFDLLRSALLSCARLVLLLFLFATPLLAQQVEPAAVFLTWRGDPTTTVTVDWHLLPGADVPRVEVRGPGINGWRSHAGESFAFPYSKRTVRRVEITGLRPDATYELRFGPQLRTYGYRTLPARLTRVVRFATGGDTRFAEADFGRMNRLVAKHDLDFVMFGGDLAYANGDPRMAWKKEQWFETVTRTLIREDNRLIPVLAAIGNHEAFDTSRYDTQAEMDSVRKTFGVAHGDSPYYSALFAMPRNHRYGVVDAGDYLSLILLNSNHTARVPGEQTAWLDGVLKARTNVPHVFPVYHVPAYPSVRRFEGGTSAAIREHWVPLFERSGVEIVFENHDHIYKRSIPLRGGKRAADGILYVGDGSWGAGPRVIGRDQGGAKPWYVDRAAETNHGIIVTLDGLNRSFQVVDSVGVVIDEFSTRPRGVSAGPGGSASGPTTPLVEKKRPAPPVRR